MSTKKNSAVPVTSDEVYDKVAKDKATDLQVIEGKDTGSDSEGDNSSLIAVTPDTLPVNVPLPCTVYMKNFGKMFVFRRQGEKINYKTALEMSKKGGDTLFVHKAFWQMFMSSLDSVDPSKKATADMRSMQLRQLLLAYGMELEKKLREPKQPIFDKLGEMATTIAESIKTDPRSAAKLLRPAKDPLEYFANHSINAAVYATLIGLKQGYDLADLKKLTHATLVHDLGKLFLPKRILYKRSEFSADDLELMKTHPRKGAELLLSLKAAPEVVKCVAQHHERMDGTGYPDGIAGNEIHPFARIVAIADVFDALTSNRPHKNAVSTAEAMKVMAGMTGAFDPDLLKFVKETAAPKPDTAPPTSTPEKT